MEQNTIITLKHKGKSNRWLAKETSIDRKTIARRAAGEITKRKEAYR